jgi:hypothetical protein
MQSRERLDCLQHEEKYERKRKKKKKAVTMEEYGHLCCNSVYLGDNPKFLKHMSYSNFRLEGQKKKKTQQ